MLFKELPLITEILRAAEVAGFTSPTPIQEQAIPKIVEGSDLLASAQTGSGKTAAFLCPILNKLARGVPQRFRGPRALVLVPTRELAMQVAAEAARWCRFLPLKTVCIYGGASYVFQNRQLARPYDILVATPGRLMDHMEQKKINLANIEIFVLDEADRMLDMGFIQPVKEIAAATSQKRQTLLFSATLKQSVMNLAGDLLRSPVEVKVTPERTRHENIEQRLHYVDDIGHKYRLLNHLLEDPAINQAIVFTATKRNVEQLVEELYERGYTAAPLHGDMNQSQRSRTMMRMRKGEIRILVATDVAARGLDIQTISHVINFDLPNNAEDYIHRIGRTGRAGAQGIALSFAAFRDKNIVNQIEHFIGHKITTHIIAGMEPTQRQPKKKTPRQNPRANRRFGSHRYDREERLRSVSRPLP